jgi:protein tyrosine phosphatase
MISMQGYMKPKTYIATQGPIPESISDFWRMVWEQDSRTVIMLTNPFEKGKLKCEVYWPREIGASTMHGNIEVTLMDMTQLADYTIRNFTIHKVTDKCTCMKNGAVHLIIVYMYVRVFIGRGGERIEDKNCEAT